MALPVEDAFAPLRTAFAGEIVTPASSQYDDTRRVFNAMIGHRPAVFALCATPDDVVQALGFAQDRGLEVAVRGGGHSVAGKGLTHGGLVVDLGRMNAVEVDPERMTARVGGGATMGNLDRGTQPYGLGTTGGRVSTTGVGGFALGGGTGWLDRKFGLACDNLLSAELVTADGRLVTASETENRELFWALHGGGGNFGVVTSLTFRLYPLSMVTVALLLWPSENGPELLKLYRDFMEAAPDEIGGGAIYFTGPEEEFVPEALVGKLTFALLLVYAGGEDDARRAIAPMLELSHAGGMVAEMPYADFQSMIDDPPGFRNYWSAQYLTSLPDEAVARFSARAADMIVPSPSQHVLFPGGGKVARELADWPVPWRTAPWCAHPFGLWSEASDDARGRSWARGVVSDLKPWSTEHVYLNFIGDEGSDRTVSGFGTQNYARLQAVKREYDPENLFHLNHNIPPG
ncbi:MAG: FAD-binding oxidoreductase [Devosia sp.]